MFGKIDRTFDKITGAGGPSNEGDWVQYAHDRHIEKLFLFLFASSDAHRARQQIEHASVYSNDEVVVTPYMVDTKSTWKDLAGCYHEGNRLDHTIGAVTNELKELWESGQYPQGLS